MSTPGPTLLEDPVAPGWPMLGDARDAEAVCIGAMLLAGNEQARAVVRIVGIDPDGQVHVVILPGSVESNRHLLGQVVS